VAKYEAKPASGTSGRFVEFFMYFIRSEVCADGEIFVRFVRYVEEIGIESA
jgi:hypothetical protein